MAEADAVNEQEGDVNEDEEQHPTHDRHLLRDTEWDQQEVRLWRSQGAAVQEMYNGQE
jgi:hypothetical protein